MARQRKQRSDKGQPRTVAPKPQWEHPGPSVASVTPNVSKGRQACDGPTTGYRDAPDGKVERRAFNDGWLPEGWHDTPADCDNCDGESHPEYVEG